MSIKILSGNIVVLFCLLLAIELVMRTVGVESYPGKPLDIEVNPGGTYYEKHPSLGYRHRAGKFKIKLKGTHEFTTHHDSTTLRITSPMTHDDSESRSEIWIFGCSFTHGWAIDDEETFPWILQSQLRNYKIVNWGVSGYGTIHFYLQLKEALKKRKKPDMVILNHANFHFPRNSFSLPRRRNAARWNFLGDVNQPYAKLNEKENIDIKYSRTVYNPWWLSKYSALSNYCQLQTESYLSKKKKNEEIAVTKLILDKMVSLCTEHNIHLVLSNIGKSGSFLSSYCNSKNIQFVDISVDLEQPGYRNLPFDRHPSAIANKIYADKLYHFIEDL